MSEWILSRYSRLPQSKVIHGVRHIGDSKLTVGANEKIIIIIKIKTSINSAAIRNNFPNTV